MGTLGMAETATRHISAISSSQPSQHLSISLGFAVGTRVARLCCMDPADVKALEDRTRAFAVEAVRLQRTLRGHRELWDIASQFNRAANSVAANYRAMCRARSTREFAAKLHTVHEEADEAAHWLAVLRDATPEANGDGTVDRLLSEASKLRNLFGRARSTTRQRYFSR